MKRIVLYAIMALCLISSSCDAQTRRRGGGHEGNSEPTQKTETIKPASNKPVVNVYIENSGSMDGYLKGVTEFESAVYNYLSDIKISDITDTLNLYYINSEIISYAQSADADVIRDFISKLEPNEFKKRGGNRGTSDIADVIKSILKETRDGVISIMVTDGIFSPGKGKDAEAYLVNQEIGIKTSMAEHLNKYPKSAVILYQLSSKFDGTYYNKVDAKIPLNNVQRPFYIWIFGQASDLAALREAVPENKFNGSGVEKMFSIVAGNQRVDYAVKPKSGNFCVSRNNPKTEINKLKADRDGKVRFSVNADFKDLLLDESYIIDSRNYELQIYDLKVAPKTDSKYTHTITLATENRKQKNGELSIKLMMTEPNWDDVNDPIGLEAVPGKTYGIKYQISGIYKAFANKANYYTELIINIK
ncbi:MAG: hypothetical protein J6P83_07330 [Bacteroidales bacterium]|nr:hypothetical protein [Bacteroidales bacterium]